MSQRELFSQRNGRTRGYTKHDLLIILWQNIQGVIESHGLLDEQYGYSPDRWDISLKYEKYIDGISQIDSSTYFNRALRTRAGISYSRYSSNLQHSSMGTLPDSLNDIDVMFDFLEVLHGIVSNPRRKKGRISHASFNKEVGQKILRDAINDDLALYTTPYRMLENGQIVELDEGSLADLADEALSLAASNTPDTSLSSSMQDSIGLYMKRDATIAEKKAAIKEIAGALESLRKRVKDHLLSDDERDLFNIANNFAIRHQNSKQKLDYDADIWYEWMFQVNLAALVTTIKIIQTQTKK